MTIINQLYTASFRGVSFLVRDSSTDAGRKTVTHEFPNADRRYVEDLGQLQTTYNLTAIITGVGASYIQRRDALIAELEKPGIGQLVHPFFGTVEVTPKPYNLTEKDSELGRAIFRLTFQRSQNNIFPDATVSNLARVETLTDNAIETLNGNITDVFDVDLAFPNNFTDAKNILSDITQSFNNNTLSFNRIRENINPFNDVIQQFTADQNTLVSNPDQLSPRLNNLFEETDGIINTPENKINTYKKFFDFNDDLEPVRQNTAGRIQRQRNRDILKDGVQTNALIRGYQASPEIDYRNIRQLDSVQNTLENQYQKLQQSNVLNTETKESLQDLRNQNRVFNETERLNTNKITTANIKRQPASVLSYRYYGSTNNTNNIVDLNDIRNNAFTEGTIDILD